MKIYEGDEVLVRPPWNLERLEGYEGAICKCEYILYIKTPKIKTFHRIKCPRCGHVVSLFCGEVGKKVCMDVLRIY